MISPQRSANTSWVVDRTAAHPSRPAERDEPPAGRKAGGYRLFPHTPFPHVALTGAWVVFALALGGMVAGCGEEEDTSSPPLLVDTPTGIGDHWDSAGIRIAQSPEHVLDASPGWVVDPVPSLVVGGGRPDAPYVFSRVVGILILPGGGLAVVDEMGRELRWFDSAGRHVRTIGGQGSGPAEFRDIALVPRGAADSISLFDRPQRRFTVVAIDGSGHRTEGPPQGDASLFQGEPLANFGSGSVFRRSGSMTHCPSEGLCTADFLVRWVDHQAATAVTVATGDLRLYRTEAFGATPLILDVPFDPWPLGASGAGGPIVTMSDRFEILQLTETGRLDRIMRIDAPPPALKPAVLERAIMEYPRGTANEGDIRRLFAGMEVRETMPTFDGLLVDALGWTWAKRFEPFPEGREAWVVFDPSGVARGVFQGPEGVRIQAVGEDALAGVTTDPSGAERVVVHSFERRMDR